MRLRPSHLEAIGALIAILILGTGCPAPPTMTVLDPDSRPDSLTFRSSTKHRGEWKPATMRSLIVVRVDPAPERGKLVWQFSSKSSQTEVTLSRKMWLDPPPAQPTRVEMGDYAYVHGGPGETLPLPPGCYSAGTGTMEPTSFRVTLEGSVVPVPYESCYAHHAPQPDPAEAQ